MDKGVKWGLKMRAGSAEICQKEKGKDGGKIEKEERDTAGGGVGGRRAIVARRERDQVGREMRAAERGKRDKKGREKWWACRWWKAWAVKCRIQFYLQLWIRSPKYGEIFKWNKPVSCFYHLILLFLCVCVCVYVCVCEHIVLLCPQ